ncbi:hypothetical protein, partial [uncultured Herbaspirillum sp.]|uniref:hypothetical protein n=1 Tax=uncultured Herbaspirillum sp. TaxID=160236 RepID=UPI002584E3E6
HTGFGFLEYANNLLFGKSFLHAASVWGRLYIITVLISGSRSELPDAGSVQQENRKHFINRSYSKLNWSGKTGQVTSCL